MKKSNFKNRKKIKYTLLLSFAFATLVSLFTSCTAEELPKTVPIKNQTTMAKDSDIIPPSSPTTPPVKP
ncbi:hypothetical protein [Flavobacterium sp.]|uniref:hypothetical protein n=1 Tax=Flavobacterium sp. TaxID=239 RepID=UPI003BE3994C